MDWVSKSMSKKKDDKRNSLVIKVPGRDVEGPSIPSSTSATFSSFSLSDNKKDEDSQPSSPVIRMRSTSSVPLRNRHSIATLPSRLTSKDSAMILDFRMVFFSSFSFFFFFFSFFFFFFSFFFFFFFFFLSFKSGFSSFKSDFNIL